ncbi:dihydroorotase [Rhizobium bangladeshense]|uniref:dihydroorotase n=1 Tax=Rhizobium bangladeshense TaxID=1138189 RepID=UPI001C83E83E|nr:dihydroorotase family protein [Rhizobium bangladeshense]MBX4893288.1 dihydroorotase family protein [Rhizobium bangladeshense]
MFDTLITGGTVVNADGQKRAGVGIRHGKIVALLAPGETAMARSFVNATGMQLLPGLVDAHAHLREPGLTQKEDFESGTHAAALGGVTTILDMPTDDPWTATAGQLSQKMASAAGRVSVDVGFQAVLCKDDRPLDELLALAPVSLELFTADVPDLYRFDGIGAVAEMLRRVPKAGPVIGVSPGDQSLLEASAGRGGSDISAFLASRPPLAEAVGIARAVLAAAETGARVHVRQINSKAGLDVWRRLRDLADVTVETTPQNLFFTADDYAGPDGANLKGSPPFRSHEDVAALRLAVSEGVISIMATDHAPHSKAEKSAAYPAFADIPGGMPGLQTLLPVMLDLVAEKLIDLPALVRMCSHNPARRFGLGRSKGAIAVGCDADILVIDFGHDTAIANADQVCRAGYTPFDGRHTAGYLTDVFLRGECVVSQGVLLLPGRGQIVRHVS